MSVQITSSDLVNWIAAPRRADVGGVWESRVDRSTLCRHNGRRSPRHTFPIVVGVYEMKNDSGEWVPRKTSGIP